MSKLTTETQDKSNESPKVRHRKEATEAVPEVETSGARRVQITINQVVGNK